MEKPLNKFVSPPVDSLLAVKQPLSEIQPKITEKFQEGEVGSLHPSLSVAPHGIMSCHQGLQILSAAATALKAAQYEAYMSPPTYLSNILQMLCPQNPMSFTNPSCLRESLHVWGCLPHPAYHHQAMENGLHFSVVGTKALTTLGSFSIWKNYQRAWGSTGEELAASVWKCVWKAAAGERFVSVQNLQLHICFACAQCKQSNKVPLCSGVRIGLAAHE